MSLDPAQILFQIIAFLLAISVHESAHAWMANRCGDPTASMLGRITLNPIKHIDPIGTLLLPALALFSHSPYMFGWAKPTPVDPRHFKNSVRDDILTSLAGPISNLLVAAVAVAGLAIITISSSLGRSLVQYGRGYESSSPLVPITFLFEAILSINVLLAVFNVIPIPPLDGSHVLRHFLPESIRRVYDTVGMIGLILLVLRGGPLVGAMMAPINRFFDSILASI